MPARRRTRSAVKEAMSRFDREVDLENLKVQLMEMTERADRLEAENAKLRTELGQLPNERSPTPIFDDMTETDARAGADDADADEDVDVDVTTVEPTESQAGNTETESAAHTPPPSLERVTPPPSSSPPSVTTPTVSLAASQAVPNTPSLTRTTSMIRTTPSPVSESSSEISTPATTSSPYQPVAQQQQQQQQSAQPATIIIAPETVSSLPGLTLSRPQAQRPATDPRLRDASAGLPPVPPPGPPKTPKQDLTIATPTPGESPYRLILKSGTGAVWGVRRAPPEALENVASEMLSQYVKRVPGCPAVGDPRFYIRRILPELQASSFPSAYLLVNAPGICTMTLFKDKTA